MQPERSELMDHFRYLFRNFSELVKDFLAHGEYLSTMRTLQICIFVVCLTAGLQAQDSVEPPFTLKQIAPRVWAAISNPKAKMPSGANAGFVIGDDGVAVIDTFVTVDANGDFSTDLASRLLIDILLKIPSIEGTLCESFAKASGAVGDSPE